MSRLFLLASSPVAAGGGASTGPVGLDAGRMKPDEHMGWMGLAHNQWDGGLGGRVGVAGIHTLFCGAACEAPPLSQPG
jgi:hypothetical protein